MSNNKKNATLGSSFLSILVFFLLVTNPSTLPAILLILLPVLVSLSAYYITRFILSFFFPNISSVDIKLASIFAMIFPVFLIILSALNQLGFFDFVLATVFSAGSILYLKRIHFIGPEL